MPVRRPVSRIASRTLVSLSAVAGLGAAFVVGTSYGGSGSAAPDPWRGGGSVDASPASYTGSGLSVPDSCTDLLRWYVERGTEQVGPYGWEGLGGPYYAALDDGRAFDSAAGSANPSAESPLAPAPVRSTNGETGTNVQEAGVDEPDVVKTDGRTLFRVQDGDLVTYDVSGAEVERLTSLDLPGAVGADSTEILLSGDTVVALSHHDDTTGTGQARTELATIDVSDPAAPVVTHTVDYDSGLVTARLHDGVVRVVLEAGLPDLDFTLPNKTTTDYEATEANQDAVRATTIEDWLPNASLDGAEATPLLGCDQVAVPDDGTALGTIAVVGFDAAAPDAPSVSGLAVDTDLVYASADQLYLATSPSYGGIVRGCWECMGSTETPTPMPDSRGLLPGWLTRGLSGGFGGGQVDQGTAGAASGDYDGASHLYAFDLDGIDTTFAASGAVDGTIRDRWSMDAAEGVLRVAVGPNMSTGDFNSILTFRQEGNDLVVAGRLDNLGVNEDIESVRWFDTLAIVVTFRQIDPLYAIDLTDPDAPRLMGSLKIPGYSAYLHPLGQHRLLGLGQLLDDGSGTWGAQAGLFDVTDLTQPRQLDVVHYGPGSQAMATNDPRQLTWLPDGRTVLTVIGDPGARGNVGYVSVLTLGDGKLSNRMVEVEYGDEVAAVRLVPLADGRVVLVTGDDASFFAL
jgi:Beta propeller domain